jgi:hypothetical protein
MVVVDMPEARGQETRILTGVKWIFFTLGAVSLGLFLLEPDLHAHPQLVLVATTGLFGTLLLHALSGVLGSGPKP